MMALKQFSIDVPGIDVFRDSTDNAGNFHFNQWLQAHFIMEIELNIRFLSSTYDAPGHGKGACNRSFGAVKKHLYKVISHDNGTDITNSSDLVKAFTVLCGVCNNVVASVNPKNLNHFSVPGKDTPAITSCYHFEYDQNNPYSLTVFRFYGIGEGQKYQFDKDVFDSIPSITMDNNILNRSSIRKVPRPTQNRDIM